MSQTHGRGSLIAAGLTFGMAAGIAAGTYVLAPHLASESEPGRRSANVEELTQVKREADINRAQADSADSLIHDFATTAVKNSLKDTPVLVIKTYDAHDDDVAALDTLLRDAGAINAGSITLSEGFFSPDKADTLKSIAATTLPAGAQLSEEHMDPGYHAGEALAASLLANKEGKGRASDEERDAVLDALSEAGLISYDKGSLAPARGVVIVGGDSASHHDDGFASKILADVATSMDNSDGAVVLAARLTEASDDGVIGVVRSNSTAVTVSTVDSIGRSFGRMATILALRDEINGHKGAYGAASNAEAASPSVGNSTASAPPESEQNTNQTMTEEPQNEQPAP